MENTNTEVLPHEYIDMYQEGQVDENAEHFEDNEDDDNGVVTSLAGTEHKTPDQGHVLEYQRGERGAMLEAARELQRTLTASRTFVQRVIGASSEIRTTVVPLFKTEPTKLCEVNPLRSRILLSIQPTNLGGAFNFVAISPDAGACRPFDTSSGEIPLGAFMLASMYTQPPLELHTVRELWAIVDNDSTATQLYCSIIEEFVA